MSQEANPVPDALLSRLPDRYQKMMAVLSQENGLAKIMLQNVYGSDPSGQPTTSQAEIVADMFNIMRLDTKALGKAAGIEINVKRMTPERAAELLQGLVKGSDFALIQQFNNLEDKREAVLRELTDDETVEQHQAVKQGALFSEIAEDESGGNEDAADEALPESDSETDDE